jgi:hypothetical protein
MGVVVCLAINSFPPIIGAGLEAFGPHAVRLIVTKIYIVNNKPE